MNYYNEFEPKAAAALRQLINDGLLPPGEVDTRSIADVRPEDLKGFTQCHFFAGIGGWSRALDLAEWPRDRPVWTGSPPCQDYSAAGQQKGREGERHLWPALFGLAAERKPPTLYGEQVKNSIAFGWLDEVFYDLETKAYACAAAVLPALSVEKPHERERLFFVAHAPSVGLDARADVSGDIPKNLGGQPGGALIPRKGAGSRIFFTSVDGIHGVSDGLPERMDCLHMLGNAIVPSVAARFIKATEGWGQ